MNTVIEVKDLVKEYGKSRAVDRISFDVKSGEIFTLVGPNGAGKTTTVEILECLRKPTSGRVTILGYEIAKDEAKIKKRIGVVPQEFNAFERLTVLENVKLIADIYGRKGELKSYLELLDLWDVRNKKFKILSGGMKRRVGICMAAVSEPEILFLDEPTTGLDPEARRETWGVIKKLKETGKTVFLTTHYMEEAEKLSDRVAVIVKGKIVAMGAVKEMIEKHGGGYRVFTKVGGKEVEAIFKKYTDSIIKVDGGLCGKFLGKRDAAKVALDLYSRDIEAEIVEPGMEEVFLSLVGRKINERGEFE
ncbi:MAG: ABC transporter ATP-binding protein [Thermoplasmata archaeon]|nr:ABC transporter ATP-binding protein [Thermoplasmata archaeon]